MAARTVTLDETFYGELEYVAADVEKSADAAEEAMTSWLATGALGADGFPLDVVVNGGPHGIRRFRFESPPAFVMVEQQACRVCGCCEDRACEPPCSWVDDDLCDNPACLAAVKEPA